ncbi:MAG: hypothetical protein ACO3CH_00125 [Ilumatobacteraceae bacterium]|nr:hypothetical protein [Chitinophagales bacterium]
MKRQENYVWVSETGTWGEASSLTYVCSDDWTEEDWDAFKDFSEDEMWEYAELAQNGGTDDDGNDTAGMTPTQYLARKVA